MLSTIDTEANSNLLKTFNKIHDIIWEGGKNDPLTAFDEFVKVIFLKLIIEKDRSFNFQEYYTHTTDKEFESFLLGHLANQKDNLLVNNESLLLSASVIKKIYTILDKDSNFSLDEDVKGRAFEFFLGKIFRDELGQYFTPRNITSFMVKFLSPTKDASVLDPACGSGGFLISCYHYLKNSSGNFTIQGIDINTRIVNAAKLEFLLYNLDLKCLKNANSLLSMDSIPGLDPEQYDYIITNPPFGSVSEDTNILENYVLSENKKAQKTEILFIERCIQLLKKGGKMGIVIPDSILTNSSLKYVRDFIFDTTKVLAVISLPSHAFVPSGAGVKSSLLFLEKTVHQNERKEVQSNADKIKTPKDYDIFVAAVQNIGFNGRGDITGDDLPTILQNWNKFLKGKQNFEIGFIEKYSKLSKDFSIQNQDEKTLSPEKWDFLPLEHLLQQIFIGKTPVRQAYADKETNYKILKVRDLTGRGIDWSNTERGFVYTDFYNKHKKLIIQEDDILFITSAHHPKYIGMKIDVIDYIPERYHKQGVLVTAELMVLRINKNKIDPYYIYLFLKSKIGYEAIQSCIRGQSAHIYPKDIRAIKIPIPKNNNFNEIDTYEKEIKESLLNKSKSDQNIVENITLSERFFSD